jgi:serine/threonine-protein kinase
MGVVWSATSTRAGSVPGPDPGRFALKFLRPDRIEDQKNTKRMIREARAAAAVDHPNVARVFEVGELESGLPFIVMELLEGETLAERLRRLGKLSADETARILAATAGAIEAAQGAGIIHRDLKPDNVFLVRGEDAETVKVLDFGIAKTLAPGEAETDATSLTTTGTMIGTVYYMAPEQIFGDEDIDGRADVWALGVILYECLSGKRPTQAAGVGQVIKLVTTNAIVPLREVAPDAPVDLSTLAMRALARSRDARPSIAEMRAALERHLRGERAPRRRGWAIAAVTALTIGGAAAFAVAHSAPAASTGTVAASIAAEPPAIDAAITIALDAGSVISPPDAQTPVAPPRRTIDAGARASRDAAPDAFDIPLSDVRK